MNTLPIKEEKKTKTKNERTLSSRNRLFSLTYYYFEQKSEQFHTQCRFIGNMHSYK